uniref:Uncharacterized protein n=1 Tax=Steinernema glaseri TaxID=37863 RepID=A0A1I8ATS1_9BILA
MKIVFVAVSLVAFAVSQPSAEVKPPQPVPQPASPNQKQGGADGTAFAQPQGFSFPVPVYPQTAFQPTHRTSSLPVIRLTEHLENVCDFDAVAMITSKVTHVTMTKVNFKATQKTDTQESHSDRLTLTRKINCADVAVLDEDTCTKCCRLSARTQTPTVRNEEIEGVLVYISEINMDVDDEPANQSEGYRTIDDTPKINTVGVRYNNKFRCKCCAPREAHIPQPFFPYAFPQQFGR